MKKIDSRFCKGFALWKYSFRNHPMCNERKTYRYIYYELLKQILLEIAGEHSVYKDLLKKLRTRLDLAELKKNDLSKDRLWKSFSGKIFWHGGLSFGWRDHRILLLMEAALLSWALHDKIDIKALGSYARLLKMGTSEMDFLLRYIPHVFTDEEELGKIIRNHEFNSFREDLSYLLRQLENEYKRAGIPRYRVAVCAPMSSGKSTILNAMLGESSIPFGNMACTAKIISLEHDCEQDRLIGAKRTNENLMVYSEVTNDILEEWNADEKADRIFLTGNIKEIHSQKRILQIFDTPGTNSSQNAEHGGLTKKFLLEEPLDLILYVCNAEHAGTTDEADFLIWLKKNIIEDRGKEILFVLNKMDSLDSENEDIADFLHEIYEGLSSIGFNTPSIIPVSSNATRLFRMALKNRNMTRKNRLDFRKYYYYFMDMEHDFRKLIRDSYPSINTQYIDNKVEVDGEEFLKQDLLETIERTGIPALERILEEKIEGAV